MYIVIDPLNFILQVIKNVPTSIKNYGNQHLHFLSKTLIRVPYKLRVE